MTDHRNKNEAIMNIISGASKIEDDKIRDLQRARDTVCLVYGIPYDEIMKLEDEIKKAGISAGITVGGLQIYANYQDSRVVRICKKFKTVAEPGVSRFVEKAIFGITKPIVNPESMMGD